MEAIGDQLAVYGGSVTVLTRASSASRFAGQTPELSRILEHLQILAGLSRPGPPGLYGARQLIFGPGSAARFKCQCSLEECFYGSS
ncbi:hypothetical protein QFZ30_000370 [Arthrobacter pascens]|uniref:hypothetical protein n=1 Tax=Arthrobacter pascens TaxID=1677 RepID=UPI00278CA69E|nr:hypothetical protein [Arthrobacter pascens]MDQ0676988.1 hypothetical protein [Arthrobacter pascens]